MKTTNDEKDGTTSASDELISKEIASKLREVDSLLLKKSKLQALSLSLRNPPAGNKSEAIKVNTTTLLELHRNRTVNSNYQSKLQDSNAFIIEKVLLSLQDSEISDAIDSLDLDSCDILLKYVYKFMGKLQNCALMLKLHALLCERAGPGSIIRVLTDRKQV
jgi:hypothetical protein